VSALNVSSLRKFSENLRGLSKTLGIEVAQRAAGEITVLAQRTFSQSEDAYGVPWTPGFDGRDVTLRKSGVLASTIRYVAIGTKLRVALGVPYAKYQVGKRPVFPTQDGVLPATYSRTLERVTREVAAESLMRGVK
jgi:hypothetical protein